MLLLPPTKLKAGDCNLSFAVHCTYKFRWQSWQSLEPLIRDERRSCGLRQNKGLFGLDTLGREHYILSFIYAESMQSYFNIWNTLSERHVSLRKFLGIWMLAGGLLLGKIRGLEKHVLLHRLFL